MNECIFCKIVSGEIPSNKVYEDEHTLAFLDIRPTNHGHALVIPKDHFENIYTIPDETMVRLSLTVKNVALAVKQGVEAEGVNVVMNNEAPAGQIIFHAHFHIIPRFKNDGFKPWPQKEYLEGEASTVAERIKESF